MTSAIEIVQSWSEGTTLAVGVARMRQLARSPDTRVLGEGSQEVEVGRVLANWTIRQQSASESQIPMVGLHDLLAALRKLPPSRKVQQIALKRGKVTGLIFFDPISRQTLGAVIAKQTPENEARSVRNFQIANAPQIVDVQPGKQVRSARALSHTA